MKQDPVVETEEVKSEAIAEDNSTTEDSKQSSEESGEEKVSKPSTFKVPDGRELTAEEVYAEYNKLLPEFTKRSQKLAEIERQSQEAKAKAEEDAREAANNSDLMKDLDPSVKEAIIQIVKPLFQDYDKRKSEESFKEQQDKQFEAELRSLEGKYDGKDGLPKFDRTRVLEAMQADGNRIFDPESMYQKLHEKEYTDNLIKQALKQKSGGNNLETTGIEEEHKPDDKSPKTFAEAAKRAFSRF
jgi:hypothetical protein